MWSAAAEATRHQPVECLDAGVAVAHLRKATPSSDAHGLGLRCPCTSYFRQAALEITARYCGRELEQYGQCVAAKPESWQRDCHQLKISIAQCTSSHPIIRQIRQACAEPFEAFEECLRQNEAAVGNCAEHVRRFLQCAEQVQLPPSPSNVEDMFVAVSESENTVLLGFIEQSRE
ncbi:Coiled-coil-helix-coiled-coil-helix domain-containing protein 5 [Galemys pyrenaicus]|uniref:Coiled-coil-helix-coiled-coil-helix domain-containing protein 5 n=1 Tax=Galemys pyrenaicus TaxID=202257 RepID=A0A8J6DKN6_GALPY|nr:Coiled-coil-helix-coiled-coil-helix domain-containing protein 5 [Galemys pyrenaicus]